MTFRLSVPSLLLVGLSAIAGADSNAAAASFLQTHKHFQSPDGRPRVSMMSQATQEQPSGQQSPSGSDTPQLTQSNGESQTKAAESGEKKHVVNVRLNSELQESATAVSKKKH